MRHRAGLTTFERATAALAQRLEVFVATDAAVKASVLTLTNRADRSRRLSLFAYNAWLLGPPRALWEQSVVTSLDPVTGAILARNPWNAEHAGARGLCLVQRAGAIVAPATAPSSWDGNGSLSIARPAWRSTRCPTGSAPDSTRAPRCTWR